MKDPHKMTEAEALELRSKTSVTQEDVETLGPSIRSGNPELTYWLMQRAWIAGAWPLLESLAMMHLTIDPTAVRARLHLSYAARQQGRIQEADNAILSAYANCPDTASVEFETALMLAMENRLIESRKHFANYVQLTVEQGDYPISPNKIDAIFAHFLKQNHLPIRTQFHQNQNTNN